ncbi:MAG: ElyC/SanA/YdcF family protein [Candidatus Nanohalobium sp.]
MKTSELDEEYDSVVAVHGFNPLAPQDPDTKDFRPVAQDRIKEAYDEVQRQQEDGKDTLLVFSGGPYKERLDDYLTENRHESVEDYNLPSESQLMLNQAEWMYSGSEEGNLDEFEGSLDVDIALESDSQDTEENINYLKNIVEETGADELYAVTSKDHMPRAGYGAVNNIEDEVEGLKVRPVASSESYAAPETDEGGNIVEENPGVFFGERGNKLRPVIDVLDEDIWSLFGKSRAEIDRKAEEIRETLNR